ncbi:DMT family transporter [Nonomuraea sp. NPDC046570]|uniref:EamA family transporter n=1 Tax=Nonomuraea sp. NPDC046570 TaxID=3155255 RepID=UPI00340EACB2
MYYLATQGTWKLAGLSPWFAVAIAVPVLWSVAHVILKEVLDTTPITPNQVTTSRLLVSALCLLTIALALEGPSEIAHTWSSLDLQSFAAMMGLAYYLELIVWFNAVRHIDVSVASTITAPAPAVTMLLAVLLLGERTHGFQLVALTLVVIGVLGLLRARSRRQAMAATVAPRSLAP